MRELIIYGDSVLKGVTYDGQLKKYRLCRREFELLAKKGIAVVNESKMGATVNIANGIIKATLDNCGENSLVLLELGGNDCNFNWAAVAADPEALHTPLTPESEFAEKLGKLIDLIRSKGSTVAVCNLVPIESQRFFDFVSEGLDKSKILSFLGDVNTIERWQEYYSRIAESVALSAGCPIIDLRTPFLKPGVLINNICVDGIHPTPGGHSIITERLQESVLALI